MNHGRYDAIENTVNNTMNATYTARCMMLNLDVKQQLYCISYGMD